MASTGPPNCCGGEARPRLTDGFGLLPGSRSSRFRTFLSLQGSRPSPRPPWRAPTRLSESSSMPAPTVRSAGGGTRSRSSRFGRSGASSSSFRSLARFTSRTACSARAPSETSSLTAWLRPASPYPSSPCTRRRGSGPSSTAAFLSNRGVLSARSSTTIISRATWKRRPSSLSARPSAFRAGRARSPFSSPGSSVLIGIAHLLSHSRGGLLAFGAGLATLAWLSRGREGGVGRPLFITGGALAVAPSSWSSRPRVSISVSRASAIPRPTTPSSTGSSSGRTRSVSRPPHRWWAPVSARFPQPSRPTEAVPARSAPSTPRAIGCSSSAKRGSSVSRSRQSSSPPRSRPVSGKRAARRPREAGVSSTAPPRRRWRFRSTDSSISTSGFPRTRFSSPFFWGS